jgi:L-fucose mutarotase
VLKGLDPLLTPELLYVLAAMGHGDEIVVCDANFPAESVAVGTAHGSVVRLAGADTPAVVRAVLYGNVILKKGVVPKQDGG